MEDSDNDHDYQDPPVEKSEDDWDDEHDDHDDGKIWLSFALDKCRVLCVVVTFYSVDSVTSQINVTCEDLSFAVVLFILCCTSSMH